ncbi:general secretory pathway protein F [Helicobacter fennelliae MRY12-0050]|uniref:General secretory pathway protein F n=2 Tax=Helicobacter fennelliae TaxID=215 RepID=T1DWL2_9HELI|nr:general secretory pathway protein F [Helicobacter fennelliae MRY12-0050]
MPKNRSDFLLKGKRIVRFIITGIQNAKQIQIKLNAKSFAQAQTKAKLLGIAITHIKEDFSTYLKSPKPIELAQDLRQFSIMLESALPINDILESLKIASANAYLRKMYGEILDSIHQGKSLSTALMPFAKIFTPMGMALIDCGVQSGKLAQILCVLSDYFESSASLRAKFFKALFYPIFIIVSVIAAFVLIAWFVIPQFIELFSSFDVALPLSTQSLIFISDVVVDYGLIMLFSVIVCGGVIVWSYIKRGFAYKTLHTLALYMPLVSQLVMYKDFWAYFTSFAYLYESGIDFDITLRTAAQSISNPILHKEIAKIQSSIQQGVPLDSAFDEIDFFDLNIKNFISTAQKGGNLDQMLTLCAKHYYVAYQHLMDKILALTEPMATILMAVVVAWLAFGIFLPIWELGGMSL